MVHTRGYLVTSLLWLATYAKICLAVLDLHLFGEHPCGDGSQSGIYSSPERNVAGLDHVIVFQGGGVCSSNEDCLDGIRKTPNKFSSKNYPRHIKGDTILSDDASVNVNNLEKSAKWFVPYCSQDGYLGVGIDGEGGLKRSGSHQFAQAMRHWASTVNKPQRLVVVGISIGAMGVLNHFEQLQAAASAAGATDVQIILDSGILSAHSLDLDFHVASYITSLTSNVTHPLCYEEDMYIGSSLDESPPCCLSLTCMLTRKHGMLEGGTRILLINSMYDPGALSYILSSGDKQAELTENRSRSTSDITDVGEQLGLTIDAVWQVGESGGERKHLIEQGVSRTASQHGQFNALIWVSTSCLMHTFLEPAPELEALFRCVDKVHTDQAKNGETVCKDGAIGINFFAFHELHMTLWKPTQMWTIATTNGTPLRSLVNDFLSGDPGFGPILLETCHGPNCVDVHHRKGPHECMSLIEIENMNRQIPVYVQGVAMTLFVVASVFGIFLRFPQIVKISLISSRSGTNNKATVHRWSKFIDTNASELRKDEANGKPRPLNEKNDGTDITLIASNLECKPVSKDCVTLTSSPIVIGPLSLNIKPHKGGVSLFSFKNTKKGIVGPKLQMISLPLVKEVSFLLPRGAITALTGRSGSGKSTLVSGMMQQVAHNLDFYSNQNLFADFKLVYLRQHANCQGVEHITAEKFLRCNAALYNATDERLLLLTRFVKQFKNTVIGRLSGGQRRRLELCSALLLNPDILILDEPLSGLDSVSIGAVLEMLKSMALQDNMAVLASIHQPSTDTLINHATKLITLEDGEIVCNATILNLWGGGNAQYQADADEEVHKLLEGSTSCRLRGVLNDKDAKQDEVEDPDSW
eukprot:CAMPEP_0194297040 /NCGR_PEP_ID=MMETSP0169-20130528/57799_1 /TAXON_ID=218684 /ORGANISM="Corethron pennatum, Strain L29A3" /LENGTH=864 /DNA_ID=CAMNT_0039046717 /DNA_START=37 /DNA_END=2628 /DNA_ORIENTATION=+